MILMNAPNQVFDNLIVYLAVLPLQPGNIFAHIFQAHDHQIDNQLYIDGLVLVLEDEEHLEADYVAIGVVTDLKLVD